jgi:rhomboid protease GluP
METAAFGKKRSAAVARAKPLLQQGEPIAEPSLTPAEEFVPEIVPVFAAASRVPFLTLGLIAILVLIYQSEGNLVASGGLSGAAVFTHGQWWRVFTAPLLHDGTIEIMSNAVSLLLAGWIFERLIGRLWFAALFVICALGGSVGALVLNPPATVSTGASGAAMGLLAAAFVCSFIFESEQLRKRMQRVSLQLLLPSLLPALLPSLYAGLLQVDFGAQIGGAVAGFAMGFVLRALWPEDAEQPRGVQVALITASGGCFLSVCGFALVALRQFGAV